MNEIKNLIYQLRNKLGAIQKQAYHLAEEGINPKENTYFHKLASEAHKIVDKLEKSLK